MIGYIYSITGTVLEEVTGSKESIEALLIFRNKMMERTDKVLILEEKIENVQDLFLNDRGTLSLKTQFSTLNYSESVMSGEIISITGIPIKTTVTWPDGFSEIINDGTAETVTSILGEYKFNFYNPAHFEKEIIINVTA